MKTRILLLISLMTIVAYATATHESYVFCVQKVTTILQNISQKLIHQNSVSTIRSSNSFSSESYCTKMIEEIKNEIAQITENKNPEQLSQEEKDIIAMLETYIEQLQTMTTSN